MTETEKFKLVKIQGVIWNGKEYENYNLPIIVLVKKKKKGKSERLSHD